MPAYARREIVDNTEVGIYHCVSRCVRRAFLCGDDALTGRSFDHRKDWIRDRLEELAGGFAIDVLGFAVMSNHLHVLLRIRPDLSRQFSDEEVAQRWLRIFRKRRDPAEAPNEPDARALAMLLADSEAVGVRRGRLADLSWFMRALCEPIARRANCEDGVTGRFWEGRFKSQAVLDESAALACSIYVDLNPIRAGIADTPESSEYTAAYERIAARQEGTAESNAQAESRRVVRRAAAMIGSVPSRMMTSVPQVSDRILRSGRRTAAFCRSGWMSTWPCWTGRVGSYGPTSAGRFRSLYSRFSSDCRSTPKVGSTACLISGAAFIASLAELPASQPGAQSGRHWHQGQAASRLAFT